MRNERMCTAGVEDTEESQHSQGLAMRQASMHKIAAPHTKKEHGQQSWNSKEVEESSMEQSYQNDLMP
eukprot:2323755-Rhodomonas_salina.4